MELGNQDITKVIMIKSFKFGSSLPPHVSRKRGTILPNLEITVTRLTTRFSVNYSFVFCQFTDIIVTANGVFSDLIYIRIPGKKLGLK